MKIQGKILALLVILLTVGCSKESEHYTPDVSEAAICFSMQTQTKGVPLTAANLNDFGVYAFHTVQSDWVDVATTATSNWIDNDVIMRQGNAYQAGSVYYWPMTLPTPATETTPAIPFAYNKLSLFAYAPYASPDNGITMPAKVAGTPSTTGVPVIKFELLQNIPSQIDLMVADPHYNLTAENTVNGTVPLLFKHTTSRISFGAFCGTPNTTIQSITLTDLPYKGTMPIDGKYIWTTEADERDFTVNLNGVVVSTIETEPSDLSLPANSFLLFPKAEHPTSDTYIIVNYTMNGKKFIKSTLATEAWEIGKSIRYILNLGGTPTDDLIIEKVTVVDWIYLGHEDIIADAAGPLRTLTFDANGGTSSAITSQKHEHGTMPRITVDTNPTLADNDFTGWNTKADGSGTKYPVNSRIKISGDITLYAQWAATAP